MPLPLPKVQAPEPSPVAAPRPPFGYAFSRLPDLLARYGECLNVAVIYGGDKDRPASVMYPTHNPRDWKSYRPVAADVANSLRSVGFRHVHLMAEDMTLAGHKHLSTTQRYIDVNDEMLKAAVEVV